MAFGNENCGYVGLTCGEQPVVRSPSFHPTNPCEHPDGLIGTGGDDGRPINPAVSNRIALTISVTGDTDGVSKNLETTLKRHGVPSKKTKWEAQQDGIKKITFHDIPAEQLTNLRRAVAEIRLESSTQRSGAVR